MPSFRFWLFIIFFSMGISACELTAVTQPTASAPQVTSQAPLPPTPILQPTATRSVLARYYIPTYYSAFYGDVIQKSQTEDVVIIYSSLESARLTAPLRLFTERYPWVTVSIIEDNDVALIERYTQEIATGQRSADAFILADSAAWQSLIGAGQIRTYRSEEDPYLPNWARSAIGVYAFALDPLILAYNTSLFSAHPTSLDALATLPVETYRGRIAALDPRVSETALLANWYYTESKQHLAWQTLKAIANTGPALFSTPEEILTSLNTGQSAASYFLPLSLILNHQDQYPNLGWSYDQSAQLLLAEHIALSQSGASANSAKLLVDFLLSQEGQMALNDNGLTSYRPDVFDVTRLHLDKLSQETGAENLIYFYLRPELAQSGARAGLLSQWQAYFSPLP